MKLPRLKWFAIIGIILFIAIIFNYNVSDMAAVLWSMNPTLVLAAFIVGNLSIVFRSLRWRSVSRSMGVMISFKDSFIFWMRGIFLGLITPGRVGEVLVRSKYMKDNNNTTFGKALSTVFMDRLLDILTIVITGLVGALLIIQFFALDLPLLLIAGFFVIFCGLLVLSTKEKYMRIILKPFFKFLVPHNIKDRTRLTFKEFYVGIKSIGKFTIAKGLVYSLMSLGTSVMAYYLLALSLGIELPIWYIAAFVPLIAIIVLIPVSISGIGTREASYIILLGMVGMTAEQAIVYSLVDLLVLNWLTIAVSVLFYIFEK